MAKDGCVKPDSVFAARVQEELCMIGQFGMTGGGRGEVGKRKGVRMAGEGGVSNNEED